MKRWTSEAEVRFAEYLRERVTREGLDGNDAEELKEDLRAHIFEEAERADCGPDGMFSLMRLETVLGKLDGGYRAAVEEIPMISPRAAVLARHHGQGSTKRFMLWAFGVVLPLVILLFEGLSSFCGSVFFDPIPTVFHAAWIILIVAVNVWVLREVGGMGDRWRGAAVAFATVGAMFYGLLFLPIIHLSVLAVILMGMGLLSLTPVLTAWATWRLGRNALRVVDSEADFKHGWRLGLVAGLVGLLALQGPDLWTRANLQTAAGEGEGSVAAVERLRIFHSERVLLKACYEGNRGTQMATDISGWILNGWRLPGLMFDGGPLDVADSEKVRDVFFRVTGKPFNSLKPPAKRVGTGSHGRGVDPLGEMEFDAHHGGDEVAVRIRHLDLAESRFDGHLDAVSELGYGEWTMVFKNGSATAREARCHILLPRDGRVSRLTLWVNGEPMEAAFNTVSKVKAAYRAVAVVQRLDPVLVNVVAPDTVMMQCFPVPAHGEMKIRIGITAPLDSGKWEMPRIIERNFGLAKRLESALWLQGDEGFSLKGNGESFSSTRDGEAHSLAVALDGGSVLRGDLAVKMDRESVPRVVWCEDRFAKEGERFLIREPMMRQAAPSGKPVIVIDGSASMREVREELLRLADGDFLIVLADDGATPVTLGELRKHRFSGGRDNEPALREALRLAKENGGPVVWIHGPQAVGLSQSEAIMQLLERGQNRPVIYDVEGVPGPNRLAQKLYRTGALKRGPALAEGVEALRDFLLKLEMGGEERSWNWRRVAGVEGVDGERVWDQLARSWAVYAAEDARSPAGDGERSELAARYQLVTPYSGAVVLETAAQFAQHGLTPVDGESTPSIPNVPEPSSFLLLLLTSLLAIMRRRR